MLVRRPVLLFCVLLSGTVCAQEEEWWAYRPLEAVSAPATDSPWVRTPVDAFVLRRLRDEAVAPAPQADRRTLIRRLTFDLHGLPPSTAEIRAFIADDRPDAYERLVDRLLASPRYGERMGRYWLDIVHYGETHGYDKDKLRPNAWPYRDYVIRSFNDDKPFGRFVGEQLAGDVLYPGTADGVLGLGFLAAGPWDFVGHVELREGTVDKAIARLLDRDDMLDTVMSTFVSTTAACARCHDHKFDPVPQADYYRLQAVFAGIDRAERPYREADGDEYLSSATGTLGYHSSITSSPDEVRWVQVDLGRSYELEEVILYPAHEEFGGHPGPGFGFPPRFRIELSQDEAFLDATTIADHTAGDYPHPGDAPQRFAARKSARYVRVTATRLFERTKDWIFALGELVAVSGGDNVARAAAVSALDSIEAGGAWGRGFLTDGAARRSGDMVFAASSRFAGSGNFQPAAQPRPIQLLRRGDVRQPGPRMGPGALSFLSSLTHHFDGLAPDGEDEGARRAALARWVTDPDNPLTWRSIVNRVWQHHFTRGLVSTPSDFGRMGGEPSHPGLLDWLAVWFRDRGGSFKELHRLLVTSAVYRQSSGPNPAVTRLAAVPSEALLWRMPRRRLEAEALRDAILSVSGRLDLTMGGPSQRWFGFRDDHSPHYDYAAFDPDSPQARRRSVYRHIVRSVPDPFFETFDCADASMLTPRRYVTMTPLQALALLNDGFVIRQAEHFADRVRDVADKLEDQAAAALQLAVGRQPTAKEREAMVAYASRHGLTNLCRLLFSLNEFLFID